MSKHDDIAGDPRGIVTGGMAAVGCYGVLGHPVRHSRSPALHRAWLRAARRPGTYDLVDIPDDHLVRRGPSLQFEFSGLNVTLPHKVSILGYVDRIDTHAESAGAANLLYRDADKAWTAGNTDGRGFTLALEEATGESVAGKDVVILGAGGAARAIGAAAIGDGAASVTLINRTLERAQAVAEALGGASVAWLGPRCLEELEVSVDLLVNTLPAQAEGLVAQLSLAPLPDHAEVVDINYHVHRPALLEAAREARLMAIDGMGMFLWQAALSFETWLGFSPDLELGRTVLETSR